MNGASLPPLTCPLSQEVTIYNFVACASRISPHTLPVYMCVLSSLLNGTKKGLCDSRLQPHFFHVVVSLLPRKIFFEEGRFPFSPELSRAS